MRGRVSFRILLVIPAFILGLASAVMAQSWQAAQRLDFADELAVKTPRIYPASGGGFHAMYKPTSPTWSIKYRRYQNGSLGPGRLVHTLGFLGGTNDICEAGNGDIWVTWENWDQSSPNPGEQIWAARSSDNGVNWNKYAVTNYWYNQKSDGSWEGGQAKNPQICPYGPPGSPTVISCSHRAVENHLKYNTFDGVSWSAVNDMNTWTDNFYASVGTCRSPVDGSVYRTYGREFGSGTDIWQICYRRFDGSSWGSEVVVSTNASGPFASRPSIAVNESNQIMVVWDQDNKVYGRFYDPPHGWYPQQLIDDGFSASVTAIPGVDDFYVAYTTLPSADKIYGKRFRYLQWDAVPAIVSVGVPSAYSLDVDICADVDGKTLYASWEWHGGDNPPHAWFSKFTTNDTTPPSTPVVTDDGSTTDKADRLHASWSSHDYESGIVEYEYSVGTSSGGADVVGWTSAGLETSVTRTGLSLVPGTTYFINVRARNGSSLWSAVGSSNGILCTAVSNTVTFNPAEVVSTSAYDTDNPALSKASDGGIHLVYHDTNGGYEQIAYRKFTSSGWSATETMSVGGAQVSYPDVAEDPSGNVYCIFSNPSGREGNDLYESIKTGAGWSYPVNLTNNRTVDWYPRLIAGSGSEQVECIATMGAFANDTSTYNVRHAARTAAGWPSWNTIGSGSFAGGRYGSPDIAADPNGDLLAVWAGQYLPYIRFARRTNGVWSSPVNIVTRTNENVYEPRIAVGPNGLAHVVFRGNPAPGDPDPTIYYIREVSRDNWTSPVAIASGYLPAIAVDRNNWPHVVYGRTVVPDQKAVMHKFSNGAAWSTEQALSGNTLVSDPRPSVRIGSQGYIHVVWDDKSSGVRRIMYRNNIPSDATPPTTPAVTDSGAFTTDTSSLSASWTSSDPESSVVEYQYAIGTSQGGTDVVGWTGAGTSASVNRTGLSLTAGITYYVSVKARNGAGLWSDVGSSDGITVVADTKDSVASARSLADGAAVGMSDQTVTAAFNGFFYIEDTDRAAGIKIVSTTPVSVGQNVTFGGKLETVDGERQITAATVDPGTAGNTVPAPLGLNNKSLGGSTLGESPGVPGASGLYNMGLLVTTSGRVGAGGANWFTIDDGSGPVKVYAAETPTPGSYVTVTGISSIEESQKILRVRDLPNQVRTL